MNTQLSPITIDTLRGFARRRRMLIAVRGCCVGIVSLLAVMSLIVLVDGLFVITSQSLRWGLTLGGYAIVALILWFACLRSLVRMPGSRELARLIEHRAPGLREDLLSAVELGSVPAATIATQNAEASWDGRFDSPVFRALLQASVERRLDHVQISSLLPIGLIRGIVFMATFVLATCVALLLVPELKFANRLTRAMLPSAPIDRISNVKVRIIAPSTADALLPFNETVQLMVEVTGADGEDVYVETFRAADDGEDERLVLRPAAEIGQYTGVIQLGRSAVKYRVLAADAVTREYTLDVAARPHPVAFIKTYRAPAYAKLDPVTTEENHGHLEGIEGTRVDLSLVIDQTIASGEIRFDDKLTISPVKLEQDADGHWHGSITIDKPATYKLHLIASATGFDNAFDPPYEIKATPDGAPTLAVESPVADMLLPPARAVNVKLSAEDDLGLASVSQWFRINGGSWSELKLLDKHAREFQHDQPWDLYELNLRAGDQVAVKFTAVDGADHKTETSPIVITIAASGFDPNRLAGLQAKREALTAVRSLAQALSREHKQLAEDAAQWPDGGELQLTQLSANAATKFEQLHTQADQAWRTVRGAIKTNRTGSDADDLIQIGLAISELRDLVLASGSTPAVKTPAAAPANLNDLAATLHRGSQVAETLNRLFTAIVASDEADALLRDLLALRDDQAALMQISPKDDVALWQRLARRQLLLAAQMKQAQSLASSVIAVPSRHAAAMETIIQMLTSRRLNAEKQLAQDVTQATVSKARTDVAAGIDGALTALLPVSRLLADESGAARRQLTQPSQPLHELPAPLLSRAVDAANPEADPHWRSAQSVLAASAALHEARQDMHSQFIADISLYRRALAAIHDRYPLEREAQIRERLSRVMHAFHTLEAGQHASHIHAQTASLLDREKWLRSSPLAVTWHARDWAAIQVMLGSTSDVLKQAGFESGVVDGLAALPRSSGVQILNVEMASRRLKAAVLQKRDTQLAPLEKQLADIKSQMQPAMAQARAVLAAEVPSISELMAQLAIEADKLQSQAQAAAKKIDVEAPPAEVANELVAAQADMNRKLDELIEALRHDANVQDAFTPQGRERARDADDAAAMLRDPADKALVAGKQAVDAETSPKQKVKLDDAAREEGRLSDALKQLAEHYKNLDEGKEDQTRSALRDAERELGIRREMDAEYGRMERLAELAEKSPQEQMAQLQKELESSEAMKQELSDIARDAVALARRELDDAAAQQEQVAQALAQAQKESQTAKPDVAGRMQRLSKQAGDLAAKVPAIEHGAKKATASDAAAAAGKAQQALNDAAQVSPPADAMNHKAAAQAAQSLAKSLEAAARELQTAQQQAAAAADRIRKDESEATTKLAIGSADAQERQQAADTLLHAKPRQDAAKRAAADANAAQERASTLAKEAAALAKDITATANSGDDAIAQGLEKQPAIAEAVAKAGEEMARAARHEARMNQQEAAAALEKSKNKIESQTADAVAEAADRLAVAKEANQAIEPVTQSQKSLAGDAAKLDQMLKDDRAQTKSGKPGTAQQTEASGDEAAAKQMARALDELDRLLNQDDNGSEDHGLSKSAMQKLAQNAAKRNEAAKPQGTSPEPGQSPGDGATPGQAPGESPRQASAQGKPQPSAAQASQSVREAAQTQARAMAQARQPEDATGSSGSSDPGSGEAMASAQKPGKPSGSSKGGPGESPGGEGQSKQMASGEKSNSEGEGTGSSGTGNRGNAKETGELPASSAMKPGEWGNLPTRLARELMEGRRDEIPAEYRSQVEAYFRAIAQKARGK